MSASSKQVKICIFSASPPEDCETFIQAHVECLPAEVVYIYGSPTGVRDLFQANGESLLSTVPVTRLVQLGAQKMLGAPWADLQRELLSKFLTGNRVQVVLAEYGMRGVGIMDACSQVDVPLVVHFHGVDAYRQDLLQGIGQRYPELFERASAIIAVSRAMEQQLLQLGAPLEKLHYNPYGVDLSVFCGARPAESPPRFLSVGRLVNKKAPDLTLLAFKQVLRTAPAARLAMIGDGPLLDCCRRLARHFGMAGSVDFLGQRSHQQVVDAMRQTRAYVQHSIQASDGDSEGTPLAVLEASASGLPVVSTRHAGITDVVRDGHTGFLVEEGDVGGMADHMIALAESPNLAAQLGRAARDRIAQHFSIGTSIRGLWSIIESVM